MVDFLDSWRKEWIKSIKQNMLELLTERDRPMSSFDKTKPFRTDTRYSYENFATLAEALDNAKRNSAKEFVDTPVYQAIQLVKAPIPGDIVVESIPTP